MKVKSLSHVRLFVTMGFSSQECWSGLPFPSPGDLPDPGIKPGSPALQADALPSETPGTLDHKSVKPEAKILSVITQGAPPIPGVAFINSPLRVRTVESFPQILNL